MLNLLGVSYWDDNGNNAQVQLKICLHSMQMTDVLCMWTVSSYIHKTRLGGRAMYFKVYENTSTLLDVTLMMYIVIFISTIFLILLN